MFACFHHLAFTLPVSLHFLFILTPLPLLFGSFCLPWASQGRQDRPKIATRAAQEPPRSSPETPRAAQDRPKTSSRSPQDRPKIALRPPRAAQDRFGFLLAPFPFLLAPSWLHLAPFWLVFLIILGYIPAACLQHPNGIPTAFLQHSSLLA